MNGLFSKAPPTTNRKKSSRTKNKKEETTKKTTKTTTTNTKKKSSRPGKKGKGSSGTQTPKSRSNPPTPERERKRTPRMAREKEEAARDDDGKGSQAFSLLSKPKNVEMKTQPVDEANTVRVLKKYKRGEKERDQMQQSVADLDEKSRILMDPVTKKSSKLKLKGEKSELLIDEISSIYPKAPGKKRIENSVNYEQDSYSDYPRLANVLKKSTEDVYKGKEVPFWAVYIEPTEQDMEGVDEPITVSSGHLEAYLNKEITLRSIPTTNLTMNPYQPMADLLQRDEVHFDYRLVFSNTLRTMINIVPNENTRMEKVKTPVKSREKIQKKIKFDEVPPLQVVYTRDAPIESIRSFRAACRTPTTPPTRTTTSSSTVEN